MGGRDELRSVREHLGRRTNLIATIAMVAIGAALMVGVLAVEGVRSQPRTWAILAVVAAVVVCGIVVSVRSLGDIDREVLDEGRPTEPESARGPIDDLVIDLDAAPEVVGFVDLDAVHVPLRPDQIWSRRLADRPDLHSITADRSGVDVPAWLLEDRPRLIDAYDVVTIRWSTIERFRVRAGRAGPSTYDINCARVPGLPTRFRVRRQEITDEVALLDHVRTVGRITVELEDSIASG